MLEDRSNHLSKVKGKLERSLDEAEDSMEREKKSKGDADKVRKKVESDLKLLPKPKYRIFGSQVNFLKIYNSGLRKRKGLHFDVLISPFLH